MAVVNTTARCEDCQFFADGANAWGLRAKHSYKTGHAVYVEKTIWKVYKGTKYD